MTCLTAAARPGPVSTSGGRLQAVRRRGDRATAQTRAAAADGARQAPRKTAGLRLRWWHQAHPAAEAVAGPLRRRQSRHVQTVDYEELHLPPGRRRPRRAAPEKSLARGPPAWRTARQPSTAYLAMAGVLEGSRGASWARVVHGTSHALVWGRQMALHHNPRHVHNRYTAN